MRCAFRLAIIIIVIRFNGNGGLLEWARNSHGRKDLENREILDLHLAGCALSCDKDYMVDFVEILTDNIGK